MHQLEDILADSSSLIESRSRVSAIDSQSSADLYLFKQQVESNYKRSVANQIYSFPLTPSNCSSFVSSDHSSLEKQQPYHLTHQNQQSEHLALQLQQRRLQYQDSKTYIENKKHRMKTHVRNQSTRAKRKYQQLINLMNKSISPLKKKSIQFQEKIKNQSKRDSSRGKERYYMYLKEEGRGKKEVGNREDRWRNKSHRLRTEPDESMKGTFRKRIGDVRVFDLYG